MTYLYTIFPHAPPKTKRLARLNCFFARQGAKLHPNNEGLPVGLEMGVLQSHHCSGVVNVHAEGAAPLCLDSRNWLFHGVVVGPSEETADPGNDGNDGVHGTPN